MSNAQESAQSAAETDPFQGWRAPPSLTTPRRSTDYITASDLYPTSAVHTEDPDTIFNALDISSLEAQIASGPSEGHIEKAGLLVLTRSLTALSKSLEREKAERSDIQTRISRLEMDLLESREEVSSLRGSIRKFQEESRRRAGSDELVTTTLDSFGGHIKRFDAILSGQQGYQSSRAFGKTPAPATPSSSRPLPPSPGVSASMHAPPPAPSPFPAPSANLAIGKDPTMNNPTPFNGKKENVEIFLDGLMIKYHYMP